MPGAAGWNHRQVPEDEPKDPFHVAPNITVPGHPPIPHVPISPTEALAAATSPIMTPIMVDTSSDSPILGTTVLGIVVGSVAAFIFVPALAVLVFLYIRQWRNGGKPYSTLDGEQEDDYGHCTNGTQHYHDEIQLKDYENESRPSFKEVGPLAIPASTIHVIPAVSRQASAEAMEALGSGTIRSPRS